jgi:hypothetical protein
VIDYFTKYPLKTKKSLDYKNWLKVYKRVKNKEHFTIEGLEQIQKLTNKINVK